MVSIIIIIKIMFLYNKSILKINNFKMAVINENYMILILVLIKIFTIYFIDVLILLVWQYVST